MKRFTILLTLILVIMFSFSSIAVEIDLEELTESELIKLRDEINILLESGEVIPVHAGVYIAGSGIKPGGYDVLIRSTDPDSSSRVSGRVGVAGMVGNGGGVVYTVEPDTPIHVDLKEGMELYLTDDSYGGSSQFYLQPSSGPLMISTDTDTNLAD